MTAGGHKCQPGGPPEVGSIIEGLKRAARVATDAELASILGVKKSAVSQWRRRGVVPQKALLKVRYLQFAGEDEAKAQNSLEGAPADVRLYARVLAMIVIVNGATEGLKEEKLEWQADRLRTEALEFERACLASAQLLAGVMERSSLTAWDAYQRLLSYGFLRHDVRERLLTSLPQ